MQRFLGDASVDQVGYSSVYTNSSGEKVAVSLVYHYEYRDVRLREFSPLEFRKRFTVRKMNDKDRVWWDTWRFVDRWRVVPDAVTVGFEADGGDDGADVGSLMPGEERRLRGRPCERYVLHAPHPLHDSHILVARAKWDTVALGGGPPPPRPGALADDQAPSKKHERFVRYFLANFTPWSARSPPVLTIERWEEWVLALEIDACHGTAREDDPQEGDIEESVAELLELRRRRQIAAGRLFDLENAVDAFRVHTETAVILGKHRERARTRWKEDGSNKPAGCGDDESSDAQREAVAALKKLREKAVRLRSAKDVTTRLNEVQAMTKWADSLRSQLPSRNAGVQLGSAGPRLRSNWSHAAQPQRHTVDGAARDAKGTAKALVAPLPPRDVGARNGGVAATAAAASATRQREREEAVANGRPLPAAGPFDPMSADEYERLAAEYSGRAAAGEEVGRPPLNPEQRDGGRSFLEFARLRARMLADGARADAIVSAAKAAGIHQLTAVFGPGGTGKSAMVHELDREFVSSCCGAALVTAYTGVAAAPFGGPTLLKLLKLGIKSKSSSRVQQLSPAQLETARKQFKEECGVSIEDVGGIVLDECSFVELSIFGHIDSRLQQLTGNKGVTCGGIPLILSGDNFQKPPPAGTPWYKELVVNAVDGGAALARGSDSSQARGLRVLHASHAVWLTRLMRARDDQPFIEVQQQMRNTSTSQPVAEAFLRSLKSVSAADVRRDESWRFTPVGVLSHIERDTINYAQLDAFARAFDLPLVKWRLPMVDEIDNAELREELYQDEPTLWGYFVEGAPVNLIETIKSVRKLVNGSPALLDSLDFEGGVVPATLADAIARGGYKKVVLDAPPLAVNVRVGGTQSPPGSAPGSAQGSALWHGVELDDLSSLITSVVPGGQVVPILQSDNVEEVELRGVVAAQACIAETVRVRIHQYMLAFALTDFKLQGRTLPKLILSVCKRQVPPWMTISAFYVLISRVRTADSLRVLHRDAAGLAAIAKLEHNEYLAAWERGYDKEGCWSDDLAKRALEEVRMGRRDQNEAAKAARVEERQAAARERARERKAAAAAQAAQRKAENERKRQEREQERQRQAPQRQARQGRQQQQPREQPRQEMETEREEALPRPDPLPPPLPSPALRTPPPLTRGELPSPLMLLESNGERVLAADSAQRMAEARERRDPLPPPSPPPAQRRPLAPRQPTRVPLAPLQLNGQLMPQSPAPTRVRLEGVRYQKNGASGDFLFEIRKALTPCLPPKGKRTLWVYNDNEQDRRRAVAGGGNAVIRPFNSFGLHAAEPLSAGVTTGSHGQGYPKLIPAVQAVIEEDLALIEQLLRTGAYASVRYSSSTRKDGPLGSSIFRFGTDVNRFIVDGLRRVVGVCST